MIFRIFSTLGSKVLGALLSFGIIWITTKFLSTSERGIISLFTANLSLIIMVFNILGGSGIVYLASRINTLQLYIVAIFWSLISCVIGTMILSQLSFYLSFSHNTGLPNGYYIHLFFICFIYSFIALGNVIMLGKERIYQLNLLTFLPLFLNAVVFSFYVFVLNQNNVFSYLISLYVSYITTSLISIYLCSKTFSNHPFSSWKEVIKKQFSYGMGAQISNIIQFFNYRFSYFVIDYYCGKSTLGIYSVATSISEAILMIASSLAMVQYGRLVNNDNEKYAIELTNILLKISFLFTIVAVVVLYFIPESFIVFVFKKEYAAIKPLLVILTLGIVFLSVSVILAHYFGGKAIYKINTYATSIGLVVTIIGNLIIVPIYGVTGAAYVGVFAYLIIVLYQGKKYLDISNQNIRFVLPSVYEINQIKKIFS